MSKVIPITQKQQIEDEAGLWLTRIERGLSARERAQIDTWLAENPAHGEALTELAYIWDDMAVLEELSDLFPLPQDSREKPSASPSGFSRWPGYALAAMLVLLLSTFTLVSIVKDEPFEPEVTVAADRSTPSYDTPAETESLVIGGQYETAIGEQSKVALPDGSEATLNTASRIRVNFDDNQRQIILERGEVYFQVAKDTQRPFKVLVNNNLVQAVGTAFNVDYSNKQKLEVTVTEGQVKLVSSKKLKQILLSGSLAEESLVNSGQSAIVAPSDQHKLEDVSKEEIYTRLAWQQGMVIFEREPLKNALAELSRYTLVKFVIADKTLEEILVGGYFKSGDIDGLLLALKANFDIDSHRKGSGKIILTKL